MSLTILKSPHLLAHRLNLREDGAHLPLERGEPLDPRDEIEAKLRTQLEAELESRLQARFDADLEAAREAARAEGYKEGLSLGHEEGLSMAREAFSKKQALVDLVLDQADSALDEWKASVVSQAMDLARLSVTHLLGDRALDADFLQQLIQKITGGLRDADVLSIRLHPLDAHVLRQACKQGPDVAGGTRLPQRLLDDASLCSGGVVVDTPRGEFHATLDVLLRKLLTLIDEQRERFEATPLVIHARRA